MLQIGKAGLTEGIVKEAKRLLNKHRYMKVRFLRSAPESDEKNSAIIALCEQIGAAVAGIRGNTAVIYKVRRTRTDE